MDAQMTWSSLLRRLSPPLALVALCAAAACAHPKATSAQIDQLARANDTVGLADAASNECAHLGGVNRQTCYEEFFVRLARSDRIHVALGALAELAAHHPDVARDGHSYTHVIGIRAWHNGEDVNAVFRGCTVLFQSGCYHGVIQAYLTEGGTLDSARAVTLCDKIAPDAKDEWLRFQCVHGLGHGFEMAWNWELPQALKGCDWLHTAWDRQSCYGGVFMENAVASMPGGHHTAALALAASDSAMDDMPGMEGMHHAPDPRTITFKMRDSTDALYPCDSVGNVYQFACYQLQGGLILNRVHSDFAKATADCDQAPPIGRSQCYVSLGTNASGITVQNTPQVIAMCSHGDPGYQPFCFSGAVKNYIDVTAKPADGFNFCAQVPTGQNRVTCFTAVGEEIDVLYADNIAQRAKVCEEAASDGVLPCKQGAVVVAR